MTTPSDRKKDRYFGPVLAGLLHLALLLFLMNLVFIEDRREEPKNDTEITMLDQTPTVPIVPMDPMPTQNKSLYVDRNINPLPPPYDLHEESVELFVDEPPLEPDPVAGIEQVVPVVIPGLPARREIDRTEALRPYEYGDAVETSVRRALQWLQENQRDDGSWGDTEDMSRRVGYTGLGLLAFLAHGETPDSKLYGQTTEMAIRWLVGLQSEGGLFCSLAGDEGHGVYGHAIATYAISEAYGMTRIPSLRQAMSKAVGVIVDGQQAR